MKKIIIIEVVLLILVLLAAVGVTLATKGLLFVKEPVLVERTPEPIPQDTQAAQAAAETIPAATTSPDQAEPPQVAATRYFAYDVRREEYLRKEGDEQEKLYPASITKLLTSYVVLQYLKPDEVVVAGDALDLVPEDSSVANIKKGDKLTVEQLIAAMMLPSGNDTAG